MPTRISTIGVLVVALLGVGFALIPAGAQQIYRHGFNGRQTAFIRGDANLRVEEKSHDVSGQYFKSQPTSEHFQFVFDAAPGDSPFVHYFYETPAAPVSAMLNASLWVYATKPGVQLRARVVFPKEPDPKRPENHLTMLIVGKTSEKTRSWDKLTLDNVPELIGKHLAAVRATIGRDVNTTDAYIDRIVLNMYTGPGAVDIWVDELDIGPVRQTPQTDERSSGAPGVPARQVRNPDPVRLGGARVPRRVEQRGGQIRVDDQAYFFRAIRYTGTPLHALRQAGFETLWLPTDVSNSVLEETAREGWFVVPSTPILGNESPVSTDLAAETNLLDGFLRKFSNSDVLFYDLGGEHGGALTLEQSARVQRTHDAIEKRDPKRPQGGDLWDGYGAYSQYLDVVGAHRWPLYTSLDLLKYRDWLMQRRTLTGDNRIFWTWIQNHDPEWHAAMLAAKPVGAGSPAPAVKPFGPHPDQVRLLTYIGLAVGCRGLGFWSDRSLSDAQMGRARLQGMAILNAELDMLLPALQSIGATGSRTQWVETSHPNVKAAILSGQKGMVVLPIWLGPGDQFVPSQGSVVQLVMNIPGVAEGYAPWRISPVGVECIQSKMTRTSNGTQLIIDEFDLVTPVVFTDDLGPNGLVVKWQDRGRRYSRVASRWALDLAEEEYEKVRVVHMKLIEMGIQLEGGDRLLSEAKRYYDEAMQEFAHDLFDKAYRSATRALRPLRVLMREHWQMAVATLDLPSASIYATSFYSLPAHWELAREVQASQHRPRFFPMAISKSPTMCPSTASPSITFPVGPLVPGPSSSIMSKSRRG